MRTRTRIAVASSVTVAVVALAGCSGGTSGSTTGATSSAAATGPAVDLSGVCPATVVVQTDWNPEADHAHLYQMLGPNPSIDAEKKSVTGDLYANGKPTGVKLEVRAGGPAIGFSTVSAQMYQDKSITMGYVSTDEAIEFSGNLPTTAVFAENDKSPMVVMWDPKTYPDVKTIADLGKALDKDGGVVRYFNGAAYMTYLTESGILPKATTDGSYDGTPAKFVTAKGKDGQQGFATAEPYVYEHEVGAWAKPVQYQLIADTGWSPYPETMSVRTGDLTKLSPCLEKLVPVMQQADVDYFKDPAPTNDLIVKLVNAYNNGWAYDAEVGAFAAKQMRSLNIATNGDNDYVGDMNAERVNDLMKIAVPIFTTSGGHVKSGLKADDLFTNTFLDTSIGF
ncbi:nitrate ABC transporter substrate-binding protein [Luteimicrobium album]|uniref:Nitrate ABC transporter substrate-binding protein n=1 Tax=Luteimicrobium album TaxID=1054550 RepID=A0ABQ6I183_9MICO|nr:ABC transporter substrate-binding protein [Luteimicrobium album]GMA24520.1 nitrate ABC transporter substrate-binding protein [Luteimicrobium album]